MWKRRTRGSIGFDGQVFFLDLECVSQDLGAKILDFVFCFLENRIHDLRFEHFEDLYVGLGIKVLKTKKVKN